MASAPPENVIDGLHANARRTPDAPAMRYRSNGGWETITWADYATAVREVSVGLTELGVGPGEHVGILSANRAEWHVADLGALAGGRITVPLYVTSSASQVAYILHHAEARVCFVDSHEQLGKLLEVRDRLPKLDHVVLFDRTRRLDDIFITSLDEVRSAGAARLQREPSLYDDSGKDLTAESVATLVYTSGTTGPPKGVVLTHGNIMTVLRDVPPALEVVRGERLLSFLPLSHIAERMMSEFLPIAIGGETWFARSLATVVEDLPACRPTVFLAVPRVWEKLQEGIRMRTASLPLPLRLAMQRYVTLGLRKVAQEQDNAPLSTRDRIEYLAIDRVLGTRLRGQLGLDQAHVLVTAAAPIHPDLIRWFHAIGMPILELYGQTEDCGPTSSNRRLANRIGTVGTALPGIEVRVSDDGEILVRGGNVCLGYHKDSKATAALIDSDRWMHSGDLGVLDAHGYLRVTGRKKDLIITAAGKNITPQNIEVDLRHQPFISQALVVGEGRRYLAALLTLDAEAVAEWAREHDKLTDDEALASDPDVLAAVQAAVDEVNARRSHAEWIRKFRILAHDLTIAGGELTPTMKVKRNQVYEKYADVIDAIYAESQ
jgi:long-chain acyl-CoA synthetase